MPAIRSSIHVCLTLFLATALHAEAAATGPASHVLADLDQAALDVASARRIEAFHLDTGFAQLSLDDGVLLPVATPAGQVVEMIFIGRGTLRVEPDDDIEAGQLDLFTGAPVLDEAFTEAVLAFASDSASAALLARPVTTADDEVVARARDRLAAWRASPVRTVLDVDTGMALDRLGDPLFQNYLAGWFLGEELGELALSFQPEAFEQLKLGRFEPLDLDAKDQRKLDRALGRQQRKGRFLGLASDDLGTWDNWLSASGRRQGEPAPGFFAFEPTHYALRVELDPRENALRATAAIDLEPRFDGALSVGLSLPNDLLIDAVRDGAGRLLVHRRARDQVRVFLQEAASGPIRIEIDYHGKGLDGASKAWIPIDNLAWHPRTGNIDRATYDLEIAWPKRYELFAGGRLVAEERRGDQLWQHRRLERPGLGISFAVGRFKVTELAVGDTKVTLAMDDNLVAVLRWDLESVDRAITSALTYFVDTFGPLDTDHLTLVTVPSYLSQSLPGYVQLSNLALAAPWLYSTYEDPRLLIAHEIAHQWWGNAIGWKTYRDQWFTEAMADYSALLWARNGTDDRTVPRGTPTDDWKKLLTNKLRDGRPVESVGPLVLGQRLQSSLTTSAYSSIVYKKGAVVLDMLAGFWTEEAFVQILRGFVDATRGHVISTEELFDVLGKLTGASLDPFAQRFVYATGLPEIFYDYAFEALDDGRHRVTIEAEQELPYRLQHSIVETPHGLDIRATRVQQVDDQVIPLVVPFQVRLADDEETAEIRTLNGRIHLTEPRTELSFEIEHTPERLRLDEKGQVFGRFFNRHDAPKSVGIRRATAVFRAGDLDTARDLYREVLETDTPAPDDAERDTLEAIEKGDAVTDWQAHLGLADVELAAGRLDEAARHIAAAAELADDDKRLRAGQWQFEARLELLRGDPEDAYDQLRKARRRLGKRLPKPGQLLWAIAAWRTGRHDVAREALDALDGTQIDFEVLTRRLDAAGSR